MAKQRDHQPPELAAPSHPQQFAVIGGNVLRALGQPGTLLRVEVRPLWEDRYRVNVLVGLDAASVRVSDSFFLVTDGDGNILASTPTITRRY
jgi:hypothetical protein